ncbi:hypothetical protein BDW59DRAFT_181766 [Aspergillus cavernicola]|uniref:Uncharacterized protein n=1 Tax=Aspergillus cavernicola TaxID=176166 RepID=A0ABR4HVI9_9EURO
MDVFASSASSALDAEGNYLFVSETLEVGMGQETFAHLSQLYRFAQALDAWRYRASSGYAARNLEYDETGNLGSVAVFTISIRLSGSFASVIALNHNFSNNSTVVLALRVSPYDQSLLQQAVQRNQDLVGHPLLILTVLVDISLATNMMFMQKIRHELSIVEKATGQHAWLQIPAVDAPAHDSELSRLGHVAKIHISLSHRRIESIQGYLELINQTFKDFEPQISSSFICTKGPKDQYRQWIGNLELLLKFRQIDLKYNERRADNQITAIYGLLTQRDNMVGVSVAIESKKISEASKRDGSALKSLTVLTAIFFPATYIATLFSLPTFSGSPFWLYWVIVIPLTLIIFGSWSGWTVYRQAQIAKETTHRDIDHDIKLDPERAFPATQANPASTSFLASTMRQIRSHTKSLQHSHSGLPDTFKTGGEQRTMKKDG